MKGKQHTRRQRRSKRALLFHKEQVDRGPSMEHMTFTENWPETVLERSAGFLLKATGACSMILSFELGQRSLAELQKHQPQCTSRQDPGTVGFGQ